MSTIKRQHYVPQSYLSRFARKERLFAFNKPSRSSYPTNVRDIAAERFFYDLPELDRLAGRVQSLEKFFHRFEQAGSQAIARIIAAADNRDAAPIKEDDRIDLAIYLAVQFLRTKETRTRLVQTNELIHKELFLRHLVEICPELAKFRDAITLTTIPEREIALHAQILLDSDFRDKITEALYLRSWILLQCGEGEVFYTSDHPVVAHSWYSSNTYGRGGLLSRASEVSIPLNSSYALLLVDPEFYPASAAQHGTIQIMRSENVTYQNHLQVRYAYRQVYCEVNDFSLAEEMVNECPELGNLQFQRVVT
jgi:hypothetical protein